MQEYRDESEIHSYQRIKLSNNKFINELIIRQMNLLDVPVTGVKFKSAFLHA